MPGALIGSARRICRKVPGRQLGYRQQHVYWLAQSVASKDKRRSKRTVLELESGKGGRLTPMNGKARSVDCAQMAAYKTKGFPRDARSIGYER
jgi:hypothetical protein